MRISRIGASDIAPARRSTSDLRQDAACETRALVAIEPAAPCVRARSLTRHPAAPFLAQLIATHLQAPQTRARRRAEPNEAIAAYRSMLRIMH
jgi:hypothetical protein